MIVVVGRFSSVVIVTLSGVVPLTLSTVNRLERLSIINISPSLGQVDTPETDSVLSFAVKV